MRPILLSLLAILVLVPLSAISETTPGSAQDFFKRGKYFLENGQFEKAVHEVLQRFATTRASPEARLL
ncbi:MAG: hypothetical protein U5N86_08170 [Planctomycetota bacterium]|nr:hypothetical protein [Planctomycetota bacterium]